MNNFKKNYQFIKLADVLALLGDEFHLFEQYSYIGYNKLYSAEDADQERGMGHRVTTYAQHITKLNIKEIRYYKDLWFQMYVHHEEGKKTKTLTIYDDNVSFADNKTDNLKVSKNPYISPMFVMRDSSSYMNEEDKKVAELIRINDRFLNWLHYMGVKDEDLEKHYIQYEYKKNYIYNLPNIELDYRTKEFRGYTDGKLELSTWDMDEIVKSIKKPELKTKVEYLLRTLGTPKDDKEREVYDYD